MHCLYNWGPWFLLPNFILMLGFGMLTVCVYVPTALYVISAKGDFKDLTQWWFSADYKHKNKFRK